jgi:hypothetical protein
VTYDMLTLGSLAALIAEARTEASLPLTHSADSREYCAECYRRWPLDARQRSDLLARLADRLETLSTTLQHAEQRAEAAEALIGALREHQRVSTLDPISHRRILDAEQVVKLAEAEVAMLKERVKP